MKYVKKNPHVIEAIQFDGINADEIINFSDHKVVYDASKSSILLKGNGLSIDKQIKEGDYVIKDISSPYGEFTICSERAFKDTYTEYSE